VTLRHGDFTVSYCHLSQTLVTQGAHVRPGTIIALTGNSGRSTNPHLHLTLKNTKKGRAIDPSILLRLVL
ncbi:MAG: M23 family metallopeptidase, partial [Prevotella sp.]